MGIDPGTLTRGITYLYRCWVQMELDLVPEAYVRRGGQATLICREWAVVGSSLPVAMDEVSRLQEDLKRPIFVFCPNLPTNLPGFDVQKQSARGLTEHVRLVLGILERNQSTLRQIGEENPERDEWWRTRDTGIFKVWKAAQTKRLLLYPSKGDVYGFAITESTEGGAFFFRSRSCREEGRMTKSGAYKMSEHALPTGRKVSNLDLLFADGKVLLIRLLPTGAGFKVFPRRIPGIEGSLD